MVNGEQSLRLSVTSGIPHSLVLGPLLFVLFINDLPEIVKSDVFLFADYLKIFRKIVNNADRIILQEDLNNLKTWSNQWLLRFHSDKCKHMNISKTQELNSHHQY